jgi:hypothetical protein
MLAGVRTYQTFLQITTQSCLENLNNWKNMKFSIPGQTPQGKSNQ